MEKSKTGDVIDVEAARVRPSHNQLAARAEIDASITTAKQYPRVLSEFKNKALAMATLDVETAEGCIYALPRGGKTIKGPSVRLAEIVAACWQNIAADAEVIDEDDRFVYAVGTCRDLENNVTVRMKTRRRITDKYGKRYNDDMIGTTANAACAIAFRNAVFKIVPKAFVNPVYEKCRVVAVGDASTFNDRRADVLGRLQKMGASLERVLARLDKKRAEDIDGDDLEVLIGAGTAIKDGEISVDNAFPEPKENEEKSEKKADTEKVKGKIKDDVEPEPEKIDEEKVDKKTGEVTETETEENGDDLFT